MGTLEIVPEPADAGILTLRVSPVGHSADATAPTLPAGYVCARAVVDADDVLGADAWVTLPEAAP